MKSWTFFVVLALLMAVRASAVDPECVGNTDHRQQTGNEQLLYSGGAGRLCMAEHDVTGALLDGVTVITCTVRMVGEDGSIGSITVKGFPGTFHEFAIPTAIKGAGTAQGLDCTFPGSGVGDQAKQLATEFPVVPPVPGPRSPFLLP